MAATLTPLMVVLGSYNDDQASTQEVMMLCTGEDESQNPLGIYLTKFMTKTANADVYEDTVA